MNLAYTMEQGTVYLEAARAAPVQAYQVGSHMLSMYPPGMAMLLAPLGFLGWKTALGLNLLVHLALFYTVIVLLRYNKTPAIFSLLYLLHPVAVLFSRTVLSDLSASLFLTLAFLATLRKRYFLCGVLIGAALLIRTISALAGLFFVAGILLEGTRFFRADDAASAAPFGVRLRRAVMVSLGALPFIVAAFLYQKVVQDGGWAKYAQPGMVSPRYIPAQFPFYTIALLVLYPGLLLAPFFYRGPGRAGLQIFTLGFFAFYCAFYFHDTGASFLETFLVGQRFLLVILPLLLTAYSRLIWELLHKRLSASWQRAVAIAITAALFGGAGLIHRRHAAYLGSLNQIRQAALQVAPFPSPLLCNIQMAKLLPPGAAGDRLKLLQNSGNEKADAEAAAKSVRTLLQTTNQPVTVVLWSRAYRPETAHELFVLSALQTEFATRPVPGDSSLSDDLHLLQITGQKNAAKPR